MCLGIPGKVTRTYREHDVLMGKVDFGGVSKQVCLEHVPDVRIGQYVLVHVGFALSAIDEQEAKLVFDFLDRMNQLDELHVPSPAGGPPLSAPPASDRNTALNRAPHPTPPGVGDQNAEASVEPQEVPAS